MNKQQILNTLEFRGSSIGKTLAIARVDGNPRPYYFSTDDISLITKGLKDRNVSIPAGYKIDDKRSEYRQRIPV